MARTKRTKRITRAAPPKATHAPAMALPERGLAPVAWVGWQIRRGEKIFGMVQKADKTV